MMYITALDRVNGEIAATSKKKKKTEEKWIWRAFRNSASTFDYPSFPPFTNLFSAHVHVLQYLKITFNVNVSFDRLGLPQ